MEIRYIEPLKELGPLLLTVEKPARYTGGEYGRLCAASGNETELRTLIAFPDLYEIGMSNQALRILYNRLNAMEGISCDRAFAPAPDFEELLRKKNLPLYGLDTGISLGDTDILMFTLGYEPGINGVFSMLDISGIPIRSADRGEADPLVIIGGPCVSNPLPYAAFVDAFWIGEAEAGFFDLARELAEVKKSGGKRNAILEKLFSHPSVWAAGKGRAVRAIDGGFASDKSPAVFPVPGMKVVHHHGAVEIMRGCPNGCRFCHAGYWYRPMRQKSADLVQKEAEAFVRLGGYREITLSSLSSGDYEHLDSLIDRLNIEFSGQHISFQLPSLKVSSFSLNLLEKISEVRKSGLTFAVETPEDFRQMAINKQVSGEDVVSILREAKRRGWRGAKFYFMIGLPRERPAAENSTLPSDIKSEEEEIAAFVERTARLTGMHFNINIGTFVPKPHTPFQWAGQLSREEAEKKLNFLRVRLKSQGHKVGIQDPLISVIEGIASRGGERAGDIFLEAFNSGCRLDSWNEYLKRDVWETLMEKHRALIQEILREKDTSLPLPWSCIHSGNGEGFFLEELEKFRTGEITLPCINKCNKSCEICTPEAKIVKNIIQGDVNSQAKEEEKQATDLKTETKVADPDTSRIVFSFAKKGTSVFHSHLGLLEIFSMAFLRANIPVAYSQGFNPLPRLDIASPLTLGVSSEGEIASIDTKTHFTAEHFMDRLNKFLPEGLSIVEAMNVHIPSGAKKYSVSSLLWGFEYLGENDKIDLVKAREEKAYRLSRLGAEESVYNLKRISVLAKSNDSGVSYFTVFRELYP